MSAAFSWLEHGCLLLRHFALCTAAGSPRLRGKKNKLHNSPSSPEVSNSPPRNVRLPLCLLYFQGIKQGPEAHAWAGNGSRHRHTYHPPHSGLCSNTSPCLLASCSEAVI